MFVKDVLFFFVDLYEVMVLVEGVGGVVVQCGQLYVVVMVVGIGQDVFEYLCIEVVMLEVWMQIQMMQLQFVGLLFQYKEVCGLVCLYDVEGYFWQEVVGELFVCLLWIEVFDLFQVGMYGGDVQGDQMVEI